MEQTIGQKPECCQHEENLVLIEARDVMATTADGRTQKGGRALKYECQRCHRKHYVLEAEPVTIGVTGSPIG